MPRNIPSLKPRQLLRLLREAGCTYYRQGKGDHRLYMRMVEGHKRVVPIDMGATTLSPVYVLRILRQLGFSDEEIEHILGTDR
jgi:predicted RNA binding protein YcfA (HicA-like mRNA interferase family)